MFPLLLRPPSQLPGFSVRFGKATLLFTAFLWNCDAIISLFFPFCQPQFPPSATTPTTAASQGQSGDTSLAGSPVQNSTRSPFFAPTRSRGCHHGILCPHLHPPCRCAEGVLQVHLTCDTTDLHDLHLPSAASVSSAVGSITPASRDAVVKSTQPLQTYGLLFYVKLCRMGLGHFGLSTTI